MFFLNQNLQFVALDFESVTDKDACLKALAVMSARVDKIYIMDKRGKAVVEAELADLLHPLRGRYEIFPEKNDPFGWLLAPIDQLCIQRNISALDIVFVSENPDAILHASSRPVGTIGKAEVFNKNIAVVGPDILISQWDELDMVFSGELAGYLGEINVTNPKLRVKQHRSPKGEMIQIQNPLLPEVPIYFGGRYFISADNAGNRHIFSLQLRNAKDNPQTQGKFFAHVITSLIEYIRRSRKLTSVKITYVPKRPSSPRDRMGDLLQHVNSTSITVESLLTCVRDYPPQKQVKTAAAKIENVRNAFSVIDPSVIKGQKIILIDDIGTSFSTISECARTLMAKGADEVFILCIALTCMPSDIILQSMACKTCGHQLAIRFNKKDGGPFWACSNYDAFKKGERHPIPPLVSGFAELRKLDRAADQKVEF